MSDDKIEKINRETGLELDPLFDAQGLVTAVVSEADTGKPLMVAHMNAEALHLSIKSGEAHFFSRSRQEIWHKGATSGNVLTIQDMKIDCDQDAVWISASLEGHGAACHTGRKSCFFRRISKDGKLEMTGEVPLFNPQDIYK